jgi:hypothetical protein
LKSRVQRQARRGLCILSAIWLLAIALWPPLASAIEQELIPISVIVEDPDAYHLRIVTLKGTVRHMRELAPYYLPNGTACYGAYTFALEDDSAMMEVAVLGICGRPALRPPEVADGYTIVLQAEIHAPGHGGYGRNQEGALTYRMDHPTVQGVAKEIRLTE